MTIKKEDLCYSAVMIIQQEKHWYYNQEIFYQANSYTCITIW